MPPGRWRPSRSCESSISCTLAVRGFLPILYHDRAYHLRSLMRLQINLSELSDAGCCTYQMYGNAILLVALSIFLCCCCETCTSNSFCNGKIDRASTDDAFMFAAQYCKDTERSVGCVKLVIYVYWICDVFHNVARSLTYFGTQILQAGEKKERNRVAFCHPYVLGDMAFFGN